MTLTPRTHRIPAHLLYPGMVVALLCLSVSAQLVLLSAAYSDGGAQVVPDYYTKASSWDAQSASQQRSDALGWSLQLLPLKGTSRQVEVMMQDRSAAPLTGLHASVTITRPEQAGGGVTQILREVSPGTYAFSRPPGRAGLWDMHFTFEARGQSTSFLHSARAQWPAAGDSP